MTRLVTEWIRELEETAAVRDKELRRLTGAGYVKLAALTAGGPVSARHAGDRDCSNDGICAGAGREVRMIYVPED